MNLNRMVNDMIVERQFNSVAALRDWLRYHNSQCYNPDEFYSWLESVCNDNNIITVHGEEWDYASCCELV